MTDICHSPETLLSKYLGIGLPDIDNTWFKRYIKTKNKRSSTRTIYSPYGHIVIKSSDLQIVSDYLQEIKFCKCINKLNNQKVKHGLTTILFFQTLNKIVQQLLFIGILISKN